MPRVSHGERWSATRALLVALVLGCAPRPAAPSAQLAPASTPGELRPPFDWAERRALWGEPLADPEPAPHVAPVRDVLGESYYVDAAHSIVDPARKEANVEALRPLRAYVRSVEKLADGFLRSSPVNVVYRTRALELLDEWASAAALLGQTNRQGSYERQWTLSGLALAYLKLKDGSDQGPRLARIEAWLAAVARTVQVEYERPQRTDNRNNHAYWAGLGVLATGVAAGDRALFDWGISRARLGIAQIERDGTLPLEMARGRLALHYHVFALTPLVMAAELAARNEIDLYAEGERAIARLVAVVMAGIADPSVFAARAGVEQTFSLPPDASELAWAEPYDARFPDAALHAHLERARPLIDARLGGDVTLAFGAKR